MTRVRTSEVRLDSKMSDAWEGAVSLASIIPEHPSVASDTTHARRRCMSRGSVLLLVGGAAVRTGIYALAHPGLI